MMKTVIVIIALAVVTPSTSRVPLGRVAFVDCPIVGPMEEPDVLSLDARLSSNEADLVETILSDALKR